MKRFLLAVAVMAPLGTGACNKPTAEDCKQAILNMERLLGTEAAARNVDNDGEIRRCRGGSRKEAVACAIKATSIDELKACAFMGSKGKADPSAPSAPTTPTPNPGSAAPAPTPGSAAPTPTPGSAAPSK